MYNQNSLLTENIVKIAPTEQMYELFSDFSV